MQSTPILTIQSANHLLDALEDFLEKSEASFAMVIDRGGAVLSQHGNLPSNADTETIAALAAGSFAATKELALRIGETEFSALHQQGEQSQIFMAGVDDNTIVVTVFGPQTTLGLVRFYSARTIKRIGVVLMESRANQHVVPLFSERDVLSTSSIFGR
jgi:predicted regulator of Ras-like GTPase activity (Roadblock/LC7/MglB family)